MKGNQLNLKDESIFNQYLEENIKELDNRIQKLQEEIFCLIFNNIPEDQMNGSIDVPVVKRENSDFEILKTQKGKICQEIRNIQKQITVSSILSKSEISSLKQRKESLEKELAYINENPKKYLRYQEAKNFNFSSISDERIRIVIKCKLDELSMLVKEKEKFSKINPFSSNFFIISFMSIFFIFEALSIVITFATVLNINLITNKNLKKVLTTNKKISILK